MESTQTKRVRSALQAPPVVTADAGLLSPVSNGGGAEANDGSSPHRIAVAPIWMTIIDEINYDLTKIKKKRTDARCA